MADKPDCPKFHLEEYKTLRAEIAADDADIRRLERLCATACAAIWVWIFGAKMDPWLAVAFIPTLVALYGWVRVSVLYKGIFKTAGYIREIEIVYACPPLRGWENTLAEQRRGWSPAEITFGKTTQLYWYSLIALTLALAIVYVAGRLAI